MAFEEWSKGTYSYRKLSEFLHERGFRTKGGKRMYMQHAEKIIRNPLYCGIIRAFGTEVKGAFEAIISEELFLKCQPNNHRKVALTKRESLNPKFPLKKLVVCSHCNTSLTGSSSRGRMGVHYPYYHHHKQDCSHAKSIPKKVLEQLMISYLTVISPKHKQYEKLFKAIVLFTPHKENRQLVW